MSSSLEDMDTSDDFACSWQMVDNLVTKQRKQTKVNYYIEQILFLAYSNIMSLPLCSVHIYTPSTKHISNSYQ